MSGDTRFVHGAERLAQRIRTIRANLNLPALTEQIGQLLLDRTLRRFDSQIDPDGRPWPALAESSLKRRGANADAPLLNVTGALRDSIRLIRGSNRSSVYTNTGAGVRIGVAGGGKQAMKAYVHNYGWNSQPGGPIPQRRFLGIGALDVKSVDSFLRRRAKQAMDAS